MNNPTAKIALPIKPLQIVQLNDQAIEIDGLRNPLWLMSPLVSADIMTSEGIVYLNVKITALLPEGVVRDSIQLQEDPIFGKPNLNLVLQYKMESPTSGRYFAWYMCYQFKLDENNYKEMLEVTASIRDIGIDNGSPKTSRGTVTQIIVSY
jgi:hypothetical protein